MPLEVDSTRAFRSHTRRAELVEAVLGADDWDENGWVEWKGSVNLREADGLLKLARAILSFANRSPTSAARYAEGTAYVILGASHGNQLPGITPVDGADLGQALTAYLGSPSDMIEWDVNYLKVRDKRVLVATVESPRNGARIYPLHKQAGKYRSGAIFVRHGARAELADPADLKTLQDRLLAGYEMGNPKLELDVDCQLSQAVVSYGFGIASQDDWLARRRDRMESASKQPLSVYVVTQHLESVDRYMERCADEIEFACAGALARADCNQLYFEAFNSTTETIKEVEIRVTLPDGWRAYRDVQNSEMPTREPFFPIVQDSTPTSPAVRPTRRQATRFCQMAGR